MKEHEIKTFEKNLPKRLKEAKKVEKKS